MSPVTSNALADCWPWMVLLVVAVIAARMVVWLGDAKFSLARLSSVHRCQQGSVQSLSFVLTLPFFVLIIMLIVQVTHVIFGNILVQYSAYAAVRSAIVWIPANVSPDERANEIASFTHPVYDLNDEVHNHVFTSYSGPKMLKIRQAAIVALMPLGPSRDLGYQLDVNGELIHEIQSEIYRSFDSESLSNSRIDARLRNKLAYTARNTTIEMDFWHSVDRRSGLDAPLIESYLRPNTVGWQDHLTVKVNYNLPLLPGPLRLFARRAQAFDGGSLQDETGEVYIWRLDAQATMGNEGERPVRSYWQEEPIASNTEPPVSDSSGLGASGLGTSGLGASGRLASDSFQEMRQ